MDIETPAAPLADRNLGEAMLRGLRGRCPRCGEGRIFQAYLKVNDHCAECGQAFHHHRADDAPPYVVILIVGHLIVGGVLSVESAYHPALWIHFLLWLPLTLVLSLALLQPVKGALIGLQWALRMHGFGYDEDEAPLAMLREVRRLG